MKRDTATEKYLQSLNDYVKELETLQLVTLRETLRAAAHDAGTRAPAETSQKRRTSALATAR